MSRVIDARALSALALAGGPVRSPDRARLLASVMRPGWMPWTDRVAALWDLPVDEVEGQFRSAGFPAAWSPSPVPMVDAFHLVGGPATAGADVGLVRIQSGQTFPAHSHGGTEEYVVLEGVMRFGDGHREYPGDRVRHDASVTHSYVAEGDVVVAIVLRGGLTPP
ncbi:MAG: hypothetical protein EXR69_15605 [Myxococcales bacterium]|nr:hypothetical protein [Myxococcales bacterium]